MQVFDPGIGFMGYLIQIVCHATKLTDKVMYFGSESLFNNGVHDASTDAITDCYSCIQRFCF
ncbi:MAG TPA: hypothetical protein VFC67_01655 [Prolixibacteraceae bacterium]|nr:hypothetical protein [Prolixibacteraceae bacterium]